MPATGAKVWVSSSCRCFAFASCRLHAAHESRAISVQSLKSRRGGRIVAFASARKSAPRSSRASRASCWPRSFVTFRFMYLLNFYTGLGFQVSAFVNAHLWSRVPCARLAMRFTASSVTLTLWRRAKATIISKTASRTCTCGVARDVIDASAAPIQSERAARSFRAVQDTVT